MTDQKIFSNVSRRDFLKAAGVSAGTLALGGVSLAACSPKASVESSKLPTKWDAETDVLVIGAGGGGLAASIEAAVAGSKSMVLEVMPTALMSNTSLCGGVVMGAGTSVQKAKGIEDSIENFKKYLQAVGGGFQDPTVTDVWADHAGETVEWLMRMGLNSRWRTSIFPEMKQIMQTLPLRLLAAIQRMPTVVNRSQKSYTMLLLLKVLSSSLIHEQSGCF